MIKFQLNHRQNARGSSDHQTAVTRHRRWLRRAAVLTAAALATTFGLVGVGPGVVQAATAPVPLGLAASYGALTPAGAFASTLTTTFRGDIGASTISFTTGGTHLVGDQFVAGSTAAIDDMRAAYADAEGRTGGAPINPQIGGLTVGPGVHSIGQAIVATAGQSFTMNGQGDPDAVFIFQVGAALGIGANFTMNLTGGAQAQNIFWQVNGAASIGADSNFVGTILANGAISMGANTDLNGRMLTKTGAIAISNMNLFSGAPAVSITGGPAASATTSTPTISGTTSIVAPASVTVAITDSAGNVQTNQAIPAVSGAWTLDVTGPLANGAANVVASASDGGGNTGTFTQVLTVDTAAPEITIDGGDVVATNEVSPTISGTTDVAAGQSVEITFTLPIAGGVTTLVRSVNVQAGSPNTWNTTLGLTEGQWTVAAEVTDEAGNKTSVNQTLTIDVEAPIVAITTSDLTNDSTPTISGTNEVGMSIAVFIDGREVADVTQTDTTWTATTTRTLQGGSRNVTVVATDTTGNETTLTQTLVLDMILPIIAINGGSTSTSKDGTPTIVGTTDVAPGLGIAVTVSIDGAPPLSAVIQSSGWNVTPFEQLTFGQHMIVASVTDRAGNVGTFTQTLTVDSLVLFEPIIPFVTTSDTTPVFKGAGATPGDTVTVEIDVQTLTTTVGLDGTWEVVVLIPLAEGEYTATITITDEFGNKAVTTQIITINLSIGLNVVGPLRLFDTRGDSPGLQAVSGRQVGLDYVLRVNISGLAGLPDSGVGAVSLNVTSTGSSAAGFLTVYECGNRELVSSVNFPAGGTVGNAVITPVSSTGDICFYASTPTDIVVDVNGWYAEGSAFTAAGPKRVFDTRPGESPRAVRNTTEAKLGADRMMEVQLTNLAGFVPNSGVGAVSLNVAVDQPEAAGFITVYPCGTRALVASLNYVAGQTVANAVIAPVSSTGTVCFYSSAATHLVVDINGWFAEGSAFNSAGPERVFDTRPGESPRAVQTVSKTTLGALQMIEVQFTDLAGLVPASGVAAVSLNVAVSQPRDGGFITVYDCGDRPTTSSLNFAAGETVGNAVTAPVSSNGTLCFYSTAMTNLVVDINGWFAG